ncbi:MAG: T9SS type A sorting domain-containing protein [Vicingaceae bacterium]
MIIHFNLQYTLSRIIENKLRFLVLICFCFLLFSSSIRASESVARKWNEVLLEAIRDDFARPTIHARNLFHVSVAIYDSWAVYDTSASTYFLGKTVHGYTCPFNGISLPSPSQKVAYQEEAMSFAAFRLLMHRFKDSPGADSSLPRFQQLLLELGYDESNRSIDYASGDPAALGNYIADHLIQFGLQDGSNEANDYGNRFYTSVNSPLDPEEEGNPNLDYPNRWQPLAFDVYIDQSGNQIPGNVPAFLSPEWGEAKSFALSDSNLTTHQRDGNDYLVYYDPGAPPLLDTTNRGGLSEEYKWNFGLVSKWSSHLDPADTTEWDISPASIGNIKMQSYPTSISGLRNFYDEQNGGDIGAGRAVNPSTGMPYTPQIVPRADYTRVLAEFWADGPDSETPPGHWFTILNYVNDDSLLIKKFKGQGPTLTDLEWDVKSYFSLSGALHDAAIAAWGCKGWYDYIRPVSAIRYMAQLGQSSDSTLPSFHPGGILLDSGLIELVEMGDPLAGTNNENLNKIKVRAWKGPDYILDPLSDSAGVDWILAGNWWPYQRPTFITPPFAGYVSGHSTFSRAAAEVMSLFTGDEYFPGGMGEFHAPKDSFLVFEKGPSVDVTLQWATYRDASDQCSLSRIWGGIHPPADDVPGRLMGIEIGVNAFEVAERYINNSITGIAEPSANKPSFKVFPNPVVDDRITLKLNQPGPRSEISVEWIDMFGKVVKRDRAFLNEAIQTIQLDASGLSSGVYVLQLTGQNWKASQKVVKN